MTQTLATGDIAIIAINTSINPATNKQSFVFTTLVDIPGGTKITFTDKAWREGIDFDHNPYPSSDGSITWVAPSYPYNPTLPVIYAGDVVRLDISINPSTQLSTSVTATQGSCINHDPFLLEHEDQIFAFVGDYVPHPTTYLWGFSTGSWSYNSSKPSETSDLPNVLDYIYNISLGPLGYNNTYFANRSNAASEITMAGRKYILSAEFANGGNYVLSKNLLNFPSYSFQVTNGTEPLAGALFESWDFLGGSLNNSRELDPIIAIGNPSPSLNTVSMSGFLQTYGYPSDYSSSNRTGIMGKINTAGRTGIKLVLKMSMERNAANSLLIQYSTTGGSSWAALDLNANTVLFIDPPISNEQPFIRIFDAKNVLTTQCGYPQTGEVIYQISLPPACENKPDVRFRITTTADPRTESDNNYAALSVGYPYNPNSKITFDYIQFRATGTTAASTVSSSVIEEKFTSNQLSVYPNPAADNYFTIEHVPAQKNAIISIFNMQGQQLFTQPVAEGRTQTRLAVNKLTKGNYLVKLNNGDTSYSSRFTKQ